MDGFEDIIKEFLVESYESMDKLDGDLLALEDSPGDQERLASIFRAVHTMKGTAGFLAFPKLEHVTHVGENLLVPLREGELHLSREIADTLLEMVDAIREILVHVESSGTEGDHDYEALVKKLQFVRVNSSATTPQADRADLATDPAASDSIESFSPDIADHLSSEPRTCVFSASTVPATSAWNDSVHPSTVDSSIRVDVDLLDKLMNLVGELVLVRNQMTQFRGSSDDASMIAASHRLNLITTELQQGVMKTRMQPIRNAWNMIPRVVRDLAASCGKKVEVRTEGEETELDKTVLEAIKDPLTHIVRNSVDHGIETPAVRQSAGKPPGGVLCLKAFHEGGQVNIEISDDGGGIDTDSVKAKAIERGILTPDQAGSTSDRELTNLVLLPGFSTAPSVTNVSGRGVGMDVVKTNIEGIGGAIEILSTPGKGTTLRIRIPLTLAIIPALIVKTCGDQYAIPQISLLELVRFDVERDLGDIQYIHDTPVYRLRTALIPLIYLDEQLKLRTRRSRSAQAENLNIVVLQAEGQQIGLVVDEIIGTQEIVVKPLGAHFKGLSLYAGATIMGDGSVSLILDVIGLAHQSLVLNRERHRLTRDDHVTENPRSAETQSMLIVDRTDGSRAAIKLSAVARLEKFSTSEVEPLGQDHVLQYRGRILPLIPLDGHWGALETARHNDSCPLHTVVYCQGDQCVGVVVGRIVDIVHQIPSENTNESAKRLIIEHRITEIIDLPELVHTALPGLNDQWAAGTSILMSNTAVENH